MKVCSVCHRYYDDSVAVCAENHGSLVEARANVREMTENYRLDVLLERDATGEMPIENSQMREVTAHENSAAVASMPVDSFAAQLTGGEIKENTLEEDNAFREPQPIFVEQSEGGSVSLAAEPIPVEKSEDSAEPFASPILVERKKPIQVETEQANAALSESAPLGGAEEPVKMSPHEFIPPVAAIRSESESSFVKNEEDAVESNAAKVSAPPVTGIKMREARPQPAPVIAKTYVPSRAARLFSSRQLPMLVGAGLFALMAFAGLALFWDSQQKESVNYERAAANKTPISSATQSPRQTSDAANNAVLPTEPYALETEETAPSVGEESSVAASKRGAQNQPREDNQTGDGARQSNESVENQPAREKSATEIESGNDESAENSTTGNEQTELNSSLDRWISATNARNVDEQMSYYAPKVNAYYRTRNASPELVRAEKKRVFERASAVDIKTSKPEITMSRDGQSATMRFRKKYDIREGEKSRSGEVIQELRWIKSGGDWKIVSERDVKVINR